MTLVQVRTKQLRRPILYFFNILLNKQSQLYFVILQHLFSAFVHFGTPDCRGFGRCANHTLEFKLSD